MEFLGILVFIIIMVANIYGKAKKNARNRNYPPQQAPPQPPQRQQQGQIPQPQYQAPRYPQQAPQPKYPQTSQAPYQPDTDSCYTRPQTVEVYQPKTDSCYTQPQTVEAYQTQAYSPPSPAQAQYAPQADYRAPQPPARAQPAQPRRALRQNRATPDAPAHVPLPTAAIPMADEDLLASATPAMTANAHAFGQGYSIMRDIDVRKRDELRRAMILGEILSRPRSGLGVRR